MRLPSIEYRRPVQSLGRMDVNAPLRLASAKSQATQALAKGLHDVADAAQNIQDTMDEVDLSAAQSNITEKMAMLEAEVESRKSYDVESLNNLGVEYEPQMTVFNEETKTTEQVQREFIPSHEVATQIYQKQAEALFNAGAETLRNDSAKRKLRLYYSKLYDGGISKAIVNSNKAKVAEMSAKTEQKFADAVATGNLAGATNIAETALRTGLWTPEMYSDKTVNLPSEVRASQYNIAITVANTLPEMERLLNEAVFDDTLLPADRKTTMKDIQSAIEKKRADLKADEAATKKARSQDTFANTAAVIVANNKPMEWDNLVEIMATMERGDAQSLFTLNRSITENRLNKSDPDALRQITAQVQSLAIPVPGVTMAQKREAAIERIQDAIGYDPQTGEFNGDPTITTQDYVSLMGQINSAQDFELDNPEIKVVSDHIWSTLTGAPKTGLGVFLDKPGQHAILASQAEYDLMRAATDRGPGFDPHVWWEDNKESYISKQAQKNIDKANKVTLSNGTSASSHLVTGPDGTTDTRAMLKNTEEALKSGGLSREDAATIVNTIMGVQ